MGRFPWGDDAVPMPLFFGATVVASAVVVVVRFMTAFTQDGGPALDADTARPAAVVTLAWLLMHYNGLGGQMYLKLRTRGATEPAARLADRIVMDTMEQAAPFLCTLWLYCIYVDARSAGSLGLVYVLARFYYQLAHAYFGVFTIAYEFGTQTASAVIYYFSTCIILALARGIPMTAQLTPRHWASGVTSFLGLWAIIIFMGVVGWGVPTGFLISSFIHRHDQARQPTPGAREMMY